jgi:hypothetical protein
MRKVPASLLVPLLCLATACSPRDFLTRRLASDLIAGSDTFKASQQFWLRTGVVSNKDYLSPEDLVLQRHGWISGSNALCPPDVSPAPCWDVTLTPNGVNIFRDLIPLEAATSQYFSVSAARRELLDVTGISKDDNLAEVDFRWKWVPLNAVGSALYNENLEYTSTVGFKHYDDGWRLIEATPPPRSPQTIDEALKDATPAP